MSLFDFFFPEEAQASHLRRLADTASLAHTQARLAQARSDRSRLGAEKRVREVEEDVAQLTIVMEALLELFSEQGAVTRSDLARKVAEIDARDGVIDGKITKAEEVAPPQEKPKLIFPDQSGNS